MPSTGIDSRNRRGISGLPAAGPVLPPVAGYTVWYDSSQIAGVNDGASLATWPDLSTNHLDLTATGTSQPVFYKSTANKLVNNKPAVWFGTPAASLMSTASSIAVAQPLTIFTVGQYTGALGANIILLYYSSGGNFQLRGTATGLWELIAPSAVDGGTFNNTLVQLTTVYNGASSLIRENGAQVITGNPSTTGITNLFVGNVSTGGTPNDWVGPLCEILVYPSQLSAGNITSVEGYLKPKWNTP